MRHMQRTHRIDVESLFESIHAIDGLSIKYINTKNQIADIFTKGSFSVQSWDTLCKLLKIGSIGKVNQYLELKALCVTDELTKQLKRADSGHIFFFDCSTYFIPFRL